MMIQEAIDRLIALGRDSTRVIALPGKEPVTLIQSADGKYIERPIPPDSTRSCRRYGGRHYRRAVGAWGGDGGRIV